MQILKKQIIFTAVTLLLFCFAQSEVIAAASRRHGHQEPFVSTPSTHAKLEKISETNAMTAEKSQADHFDEKRSDAAAREAAAAMVRHLEKKS